MMFAGLCKKTLATVGNKQGRIATHVRFEALRNQSQHHLYTTLIYILYTIYYILYTIYYILYTIYYILYTIYYILYTIYYILYTTYYTLYTLYNIYIGYILHVIHVMLALTFLLSFIISLWPSVRKMARFHARNKAQAALKLELFQTALATSHAACVASLFWGHF